MTTTYHDLCDFSLCFQKNLWRTCAVTSSTPKRWAISAAPPSPRCTRPIWTVHALWALPPPVRSNWTHPSSCWRPAPPARTGCRSPRRRDRPPSVAISQNRDPSWDNTLLSTFILIKEILKWASGLSSQVGRGSDATEIPDTKEPWIKAV